MPNAYNGVSGHSFLSIHNVVVQMIAEDGYYIASDDCKYGTYVFDRTHGATLERGHVISLKAKTYVYYGLNELDAVIWVRRERIQAACPGP